MGQRQHLSDLYKNYSSERYYALNHAMFTATKINNRIETEEKITMENRVPHLCISILLFAITFVSFVGNPHPVIVLAYSNFPFAHVQ